MPKSISISKAEGRPGEVYHPLSLDEVPIPIPKDTQLLLKVYAAALNHRDLFIRQSLYPGVAFGVPLLADGCGIVIDNGPLADKSWLGKRVIISPGEGWKDSPEGREDKKGYRIIGGTSGINNGTLQEYMLIDQSNVEEAPAHLTSVEAAAFPLTGLTAWRAVMVKCGPANIRPGKNILITGIGGGVALMALMFASAAGANVYVTSGNQEKIDKAIKLGAKGGVVYREKGWERKLLDLLNGTTEKEFDAIVDGAGGDSIKMGSTLLKHGGIISVYGMTVSPRMPFLMQAVMKNIEVKGSTMGSRKEFADMVDYIKTKKLRPTVSETVRGIKNLEEIDRLFGQMKEGSQFGKLCIEVSGDGASSKL